MVFGELLILTLVSSCWPTMTRTTGILILETNSSKKYFYILLKTLNMWDKSYYGYNRVEQEDINRRWREQAESGFGQEKLPGL